MRGLRKLTLDMQLTHPRTNRPDEHTDNLGNYVELRIQDRDSDEYVGIVRMHPVEFAALIAGRQITVDAESTAHVERLGREMQNDLVDLGWIGPEQEAEAVAQARTEALAEGWETAESHRSNRGLMVTRRRWVAKQDAAEADAARKAGE